MLVRLEYRAGREVRFLSHLDFLRLFTRSIRRAKLPIAYSQGFNPHPKLAFGPPLAVGITGSREYLDLELTTPVPVEELLERLGQALPTGVSLNRAQATVGKTAALMAVIERAQFLVSAAPTRDPAAVDWSGMLARFMERESIVVTRQGKDGPRPKEIRPGIFGAAVTVKELQVIFDLDLQAATEGSVRPDEVIRAMVELAGAPLAEELEIERRGLFAVQEGQLVTPLELL